MADKNIEGIHPLTPLQEGILFETLDSRNAGAYFNQYHCLIEGPVDAARLRRSFEAAVARHAILRTLFTWEKRDKPLQVVRRRVELPFEEVDWSDLAPDAQAGRLDEFLAADRARGFALDSAPLMRVALLRLAPERSRLVWSFHHIVQDGWSMRLVFDEVRQGYDGADIAPAPDFFDFVGRQARRDASGDEAFWRERLAGFEAPTTPRVAAPAGSRETGRAGDSTSLTIDTGLTAAARALAASHRVTLNTVCASAWAVLLSDYCDTGDVVFGTTVSGRSAGAEEDVRTAGLFINTLPVRARLDPGTSPTDVLREVQAQQVAQQRFEQTPLTTIRRCSDLPPQTPLFETILVFENLAQAGDGDASALRISDAHYIEHSNFPLALLIVPGDALELIAVHDSRRFPTDTVRGFLRHFARLLGRFAEAPAEPLSGFTLLDDEGRRQLAAWNDTGRQFPAHESVLDLFEDCAGRFPDRPAIAAGGETVSYAELDRRANRLAHRLLQDGDTGSSALVIHVGRRAGAIVGMIAALKAGVPYVPTDPQDSGDRLAQIVADLVAAGRKPLVLTEAEYAGRVHEAGAESLVQGSEDDAGSESSPERQFGKDAVAYIIYTSGSTGRPKGVQVSHAALLNSTQARLDFYAEPVHAFALLSSVATDSSIAGIYWALCSGGKLVIPAERAQLDIGRLAELFAAEEVSHTLCVPSLYELVLEHADAALLESLRVVVVAGESSGERLVERHRRTLPRAALYNEYGPSEACVWASVARLDTDREVTIGRAIANTRLYVVDRFGRPLPCGAAGELCIGGANLAAGYIGREEQTRAVFVPDRFTGDGALIYRTGDLARYRDDGRLEYLGRVDLQLKVKGYRVEPGEIEAVLKQYPGVESAVVFLENSAADDELVKLLDRLGDADALALLDDVERMSDDEVHTALAEART